jgi:hypothetical protein
MSFKSKLSTAALAATCCALALAVGGAWPWYDSNVHAQSKDQMMETAARETAKCRLEAFMLEPGLTKKGLEIQAAFMGLCMAARGYVFVPDCTEATADAANNPSYYYEFNSICWRKN